MNQLFGILTISLVAGGYYFSWKYWSEEKFRLAVLLLVICGLAIRIYISTDLFLHTWDERYHALVAKHLIQHPFRPTLYDNPVLPYDYRNWTANHIWLHKQPLPLWTMAASLSLFGVHEIALRLPSILLSTLGIWLAYIIGTYFCNKKTGILTAFFFSINGLIIEMTGGRVATDHIDIFFLFFIELAVAFSIWFVQKQKTIFNVLTGISIGAAILSKWLPALIVIPVWLFIVLDSGRFKPRAIIFQFIVLLCASVVIFLPWQLYIHHTFPREASWEAGFNLRHFTEVIEGRTGPFYYFADRIRINYGELIYLPLLWFLWKSFKNPRDLKRMAITVWFIIPFIFFSAAKTKMQGYLLFTSPALFIMTSEFFMMIVEYKKQRKVKWFFNLLLIFIIALPVRYMIERVKPFDQTERRPQWVVDLKNLDERHINNGVLFNYENPVEAMFYTDLAVYQILPEKEKIVNLMEKGYSVIINDNGRITEDVRALPGIAIEHLRPGQGR